jgi:hypothetical protein
MSAANNTAPTPAFTIEPIVNAALGLPTQQIDGSATPAPSAGPDDDILLTSKISADSAVLAAFVAQNIDNEKGDAGQALLKALKGDAAEGSVAEAATTAPLQIQLAVSAAEVPPETLAVSEPAPAEPSQTMLEKLGLLNFTYAESQQLAAELNKAALVRLQVELDDLAQFCVTKTDELRVHESDFIAKLKAKYAHHGLRRGLSQVGSHTAGGYAVDKTGHKPVVGTTYKHPTTGKLWKKAQPQGMVNKEFLALIEANYIWEELKVSP